MVYIGLIGEIRCGIAVSRKYSCIGCAREVSLDVIALVQSWNGEQVMVECRTKNIDKHS